MKPRLAAIEVLYNCLLFSNSAPEAHRLALEVIFDSALFPECNL